MDNKETLMAKDSAKQSTESAALNKEVNTKKMDSYQSLLVTIDKHIATVTLNCPEKRNAFNDEMIAELTTAFTDLGVNDEVRVIVLAANGKAFCAGADLNWMRAMADYSHEENLADADKLAQMLKTIYECPKPTIAAIQGDVYAGGIIRMTLVVNTKTKALLVMAPRW